MRAFFEGPAGTGKTHYLIERAVTLLGVELAKPDTGILCLTFMNGARLRLAARLSSIAALRGRFHCTTFDSFATQLVRRRRSLLKALPLETSEGLSGFDSVCRDAARLLQLPQVLRWIAVAYPVVLVDEAQDLSKERFEMLRALSASTTVLACADEFQNLTKDADCSELMNWLRTCDEPSSLTVVRRTDQAGLLSVAGALRSGTAVGSGLKALTGKQVGWRGPGIRLIETVAKPGLAAWQIANQLSVMSSSAVVLTPDASTSRLLKIFERVQVPPAFKRMGSTFGPYPLSWERKDDDEVEELCRHFPGEGDLLVSDALSAARSIATPDRRRIVESIDLRRSLSGDTHITREALKRLIDDAIRKARRFAPRAPSGRRIMTIARAKNREFRDVIVVWPQTVPADIAYQRRLLYNGVTRAQTDCCVVVLGQGRLSKPPFV